MKELRWITGVIINLVYKNIQGQIVYFYPLTLMLFAANQTLDRDLKLIRCLSTKNNFSALQTARPSVSYFSLQ